MTQQTEKQRRGQGQVNGQATTAAAKDDAKARSGPSLSQVVGDAKPQWAKGGEAPPPVKPTKPNKPEQQSKRGARRWMIGPGEDRWRGGRPYDHNRQSGQRHPNARNMNMHGGSRGGQNQNQHQNQNQNHGAWGAGDSRDQLSGGLSQDQHVPVRGFNAAEAKGALRRGPGAPRPFFYKTPGKDANNRSGGPWGSKPNSMASGKDFFLELRKQVTALKQGDNVAGG